MKVTVRDIANRAGVSTASVSLVLNNKPSRITEETKKKIFEAAKELGYEFRTKPDKSGRLIGVVRPGYYAEFVDACMEGIEKYAFIHGYKVIACDAVGTTVQALDSIEVLIQVQVGGIIMIPPTDMNENTNNVQLGECLQETKKPFLLLDQAIDRVFCDFVTADNKSGGYMATEYLIHKGYIDIGIIAGRRDLYTTRKRVEGYKEALAYYGISIEKNNIYYGDYEWQSGYEAAKYFLNAGIKALFACNDRMALGVYQFAQEHNMRIGEDISLIGFNDMRMSSLLTPPLTCIEQPGELMGKMACEMLIGRMEGEGEEIRTTYFSPQLIERASVKESEN